MFLSSPFEFYGFAPDWYVLVTGAVLEVEFACPFYSNMGVTKTILPLVVIRHVVPLNYLGLSNNFPWFSIRLVPQFT